MHRYIFYVTLIFELFLCGILRAEKANNSNDKDNFTSTDLSCPTTWKNTLKIKDAGNVQDSLIFGTSPNGTNGIDTCLGEKILPPVPPIGAFDTRFIGSNYDSKIDIRKDTTGDLSWIFDFQPSTSGYPITFTWNNIIFPTYGNFTLKDLISGSIVNINMLTQNSFTLTNTGITSFKIEYSKIKINLKIIPEGLYFPLFNQLSRKDSFKIYLRESIAPYLLIDSSNGIIDSIGFSGVFNFPNTQAGSYYIIVTHFNSLETWSKTGGENILTNGINYNYDFTTSITKAYGNNLQLKSGKYCIFTGDVTQDGFIDLTDLVLIFNSSSNFDTGKNLTTDLNGDSIVDLADIVLCFNNSANFIKIINP